MAANPLFAPNVVNVRDLTKAFDKRTILNHLDLEIQAGEFVALLGRSGSGKSTLLRVLGALDADVSGYIQVPERRAIVFQEPRLLPWQNILRNITIGLPQNEHTRQLGKNALAEVGLAKHTLAWPRTLSGGEAQRAALARALVRDPQLLLLDEPFGALDALTRIRMHALLRELHQQHNPAVLLVTHDVDEAIFLADRILVLTSGKISFNEKINIAGTRERSNQHFATLRTKLLNELGVEHV